MALDPPQERLRIRRWGQHIISPLDFSEFLSLAIEEVVCHLGAVSEVRKHPPPILKMLMAGP
jgi:hypothetical protein